MLALTWFGFLPRGTSLNILEDAAATPGERDQFLQPDLAMIHRHSELEGISCAELYLVRRWRYETLDKDYTWIAKLGSIKENIHGRIGPYRGVGFLLAGTALQGKGAYEGLDLAFQYMAYHVPEELPAWFNLKKAAENAKTRPEMKETTRGVEVLERKHSLALPARGGVAGATGSHAVGFIDISSVPIDHRPAAVARCLHDAQLADDYERFGEVYISAEPHVVDAARRIPNVEVIGPDWQAPKAFYKSTAGQASEPQQPVNTEVEDMSAQAIRELEERARNSAADEVREQLKHVEKRITDKIKESLQKENHESSRPFPWFLLTAFITAWVAGVFGAVALSSYYLLNAQTVGGATANQTQPSEPAASDPRLIGEINVIRTEIEQLKNQRAAAAAPAQPERVSDKDKAAVRTAIGKVQAAAAEINKQQAVAKPQALKDELSKAVRSLEKVAEEMCDKAQILSADCKAP